MKKFIKIPSSLWMILIFSFITLSIHSQIIVLKETVPDDFEELDEGFGPNRKRFSHPLASYGTFSNKYDHTGNVSDKTLFGKSIDLNWIPRYMVVDKTGKIALYNVIEADDEKLIKTLESLK